ncbi:hypothetical protein R1sor_014231 [Riccia sorocarpa]|uniref:Uncharacterized protein n=1 Tax=Riccia sorocarpa TaxID=122646 RepID=A0ABD3HBE5_9MARC
MEHDRAGTMEADVPIVADYRQDCSHIVESGFSSASKKSPDSSLGDFHPVSSVGTPAVEINQFGLGVMAPRVTDASIRKPKCSVQDYEQIVNYIEDPVNFAALHGAGKKTKIDGQVMTKGKAFSVMAAKLSGNHGFPHLQGDELKKRYERYYDMYKRAREWLAGTGSGLTEEEISLGYTIEKKMHEKCPHFYRMNAIFGNRANVNPPALGSLGLGSEEIPSVVDSQLPGIEECQIGVEIPEESRIVEEDHADEFLAEEFYVDAEPTDGDEEVHTEHAGPNMPTLQEDVPAEKENSDMGRSTVAEEVAPAPEGRRKQKGDKNSSSSDPNQKQSLSNLYMETQKQKQEFRNRLLEFRHAQLDQRNRLEMLKLQRLEDEENRRRESVRLEEVKKRRAPLLGRYSFEVE